jgi:hypothetical protein
LELLSLLLDFFLVVSEDFEAMEDGDVLGEAFGDIDHLHHQEDQWVVDSLEEEAQEDMEVQEDMVAQEDLDKKCLKLYKNVI